jgi:hypothetical protein
MEENQEKGKRGYVNQERCPLLAQRGLPLQNYICPVLGSKLTVKLVVAIGILQFPMSFIHSIICAILYGSLLALIFIENISPKFSKKLEA